jgi:hypothetical protein
LNLVYYLDLTYFFFLLFSNEMSSRDQNVADPSVNNSGANRTRSTNPFEDGDDVVIARRQYEAMLAAMETMALQRHPPRAQPPDPKVSVTPFTGADRNYSVKDFLMRCKDAMRANRVPEGDFLNRWMPAFLEGKARHWYENEVVTLDWQDLEYRMHKRFSTTTRQDELLTKIHMRRMAFDEDVVTYIDSLVNLNYQLIDPISDTELIKIALRSVSAKLRAMIGTKRFLDIHELSAELERIQRDVGEAVQEQQRFEYHKAMMSCPPPPIPPSGPPVAYPSPVMYPPGIVYQQQRLFNDVPRDTSRVRCYRCNQLGHFSRTCTTDLSLPTNTLNPNRP